MRRLTCGPTVIALTTLLMLLQAGSDASRSSIDAARSASISGIVVDDRGKPLDRAFVAVTSVVLPGVRSILSGDDGRFEFVALPAGRFTLLGSKEPFLDAEFGQQYARGAGTPIRLTTGQHFANIRLALTRPASIDGQLMDAHGVPVQGTMVVAFHVIIDGGARVLRGAVNTVSGPDGRFHLAELRGDTYFVEANSAGSTVATVALRDSERRTGVAVRLGIPPPGSTIEGNAVAFDGKSVSGLEIDLSSADDPQPWFTRKEDISDPGHFRFSDVPAGRYRVTAKLPSVHYWASANVVVDGRTAVTVPLTLRPGVSISGRITFDTTTALPSLADVCAIVSPIRSPVAMYIDSYRFGDHGNILCDTRPDGAFSVPAVPAGQYVIGAWAPDRVLEGWRHDATLLDGRDVTDVPVPVAEGAALTGIEIRFSDHVRELAGTLDGRSGRRTSLGTVVVFPVDERMWALWTRRIRVTRPDTAGEFSLSGLLPGEYLVAAVGEIKPDGWRDFDYLRQLRSGASRVVLPGQGTAHVALRLR